MIHRAKQQLVKMGFREIEQFQDGFGTIGYGVRFQETDYVLVAKEYAHNDLASFMAKFVVKMGEDVNFIFYNNDTDSYTVFDGVYLQKHGEPSSGPSKKRDCSWREIPLSRGAELDSFIKGNESPDTLAGENETLGVFM